jgi:carbonic anhydrase
MFTDILEANRAYAAEFALAGLEPTAARGLAIVTCVDTRIEPLAMLGLAPGDAKILRNAGARVTDDTLRSLALVVHLLGVDRVALVQHTGCALVGTTNEELRARLGTAASDARGWDFLPIADHEAALREDIGRIRDCSLLPAELPVAGFVYDVGSGVVRSVVAAG